ncbi:MAG: peptidoglycan bridge formation glycyltransferase FemA/FemB family protein [Bacteroidales bacterium]|nr:peptidoglycan bridge formation glycyltransferase FemA/FemB family protein [Bacteroidales bacterium]
MSNYNFKIIHPADQIWAQIDSAYEQTIFHTKEWFAYLHKIYSIRPFMVSVIHDNQVVGFFVGQKKWGGVNALYSPPMNTGTNNMGIVMFGPTTSEQLITIYQEFANWVFKKKIAQYIKIDDWNLHKDTDTYINESVYQDTRLLDIQHQGRPTYYINLKQSEDKLWHTMHYKSCRYCINKAIKNGLFVRRITDKNEITQFVKIHRQQICDVSRRKGIATRTYQEERKLLALCNLLFPNKVLLLQVIGNDDEKRAQVMASGIWLIGKKEAVWWTGASFQRYQHYCPNELMLWEALRIIKKEGCESLNLCGMASYKRKYGSTITYVPRLFFRSHPYIITMDEILKKIYRQIQFYKRKLKGKI